MFMQVCASKKTQARATRVSTQNLSSAPGLAFCGGHELLREHCALLVKECSKGRRCVRANEVVSAKKELGLGRRHVSAIVGASQRRTKGEVVALLVRREDFTIDAVTEIPQTRAELGE